MSALEALSMTIHDMLGQNSRLGGRILLDQIEALLRMETLFEVPP